MAVPSVREAQEEAGSQEAVSPVKPPSPSEHTGTLAEHWTARLRKHQPDLAGFNVCGKCRTVLIPWRKAGGLGWG